MVTPNSLWAKVSWDWKGNSSYDKYQVMSGCLAMTYMYHIKII